MSVSIRIPTILRTYTGGESVVEVEPTVETLQGSFDALDKAAPGILARLLDDVGALRRFINIYIDDEDVRFIGGLQAPLADGNSVTILPAVAGG
jgi:molybdopterin converting factor small subunit